MPAIKTFRTAVAFRAWLLVHHETAPELVVRIFKAHATARGIGYAEALDEALCFGWIDAVRRALDADSYSIRFTRRRPRSIWSKVNVAHVERLERTGRMTPAGRAAFAAREANRTGIYSFEQPQMELAPAFARRLQAERAAWSHFQREPAWYRRLAIHWVMTAKREATRERRLDILIASSAAGLRIPSQRPRSSNS